MEQFVNIKLKRDDIGQIIDSLQCRLESWRNTQKYLEGEPVDCVIEECSDAE